MPDRHRAFFWALMIGIAGVYGLVAFEVAHAEYALVSDYIDVSLMHGGWWPAGFLRRLVDPFEDGAWLYRPFADALSWVLALMFKEHVGVWHAVLILSRALSTWAAYAVARQFVPSVPATCAATAYFAFFPAIPEIDLIRVETALMPTLALAFYGYLRLARGSATTRVTAITAIAFVLATMTKEVVAPILIVLLILTAPPMWRRGAASRVALGIMIVAMLNQAYRFLLVLQDPYSQPSAGGLLHALFTQARWTAKIMLLVTTSFPLVPLVLIGWIVLGLMAIGRDRSRINISALLLAGLSVAMGVAAPYPALRYLSPAAFFLVPLIALGVEESRRRISEKGSDRVAFATMVLMIVFGGAVLCAQAASMRNSTRADWLLLQHAARALAAGRDVYMIEDYEFERAFWVRAELAGVDPRYPFITYVAKQALSGQTIVWPPPPMPPVNLTGLVPAEPRGRFATVKLPYDFPPGSLVIPASPELDRLEADVAVERRIDFRYSDVVSRVLGGFFRMARLTNPKFRYVHDLGESPFPGHYWMTFSGR